MKIAIKSVPFFLLSIFMLASCSSQERSEEMAVNKSYASPEDAANKGKSDLLEVLGTNLDIDLRIDPAKLKEAQLGKLISYVELDFAKLLTTDSLATLSDIVAGEKSMIAPFVADGQVVTIIEVGKTSDGWEVTALANSDITNGLNQTGFVGTGEAKIILYEVPNLNLFIYGVTEDSKERYFLNFEEFTLKQQVELSAFYPLMRKRAIAFDKKFGDRIQSEKLVK